MRSSTVVALAILIASSPSIAAPAGQRYPAKGSAFPGKGQAANSHGRKPVDFNVREVEAADQSGAVNLGKALNIAGGIGGAASLLGSLIPGHDQQKREELLELLARQDDSDSSGAASLGKIFNIVSGVGGAAGLLGSLAGNHDQQQKREEIIELLARQDGADASGAANLGKILNIAGGVGGAASLLGSLLPNHDQQQQRRAEDLLELIVRQEGDASSGAVNWGQVADVGSKVISGLGTAAGIAGTGVGIFDKLHSGQRPKREDSIEFLVREDPLDSIVARGAPTKALENTNTVLGGASGFVNLANALVDHFHKNKREELMELLARQDSTDGAGELDVGEILHKVTGFLGFKRQEADIGGGDLDVGEIFHKVTSFLGFKRQEVDGGAGDLDIGNIIHKLTSFLGFKREDVTDQSGAFDFGKLIKNVAGLILKRDDVSDSEALATLDTLNDLLHGHHSKRQPIVLRPGMKPIDTFHPEAQLADGVRPKILRSLNDLD